MLGAAFKHTLLLSDSPAIYGAVSLVFSRYLNLQFEHYLFLFLGGYIFCFVLVHVVEAKVEKRKLRKGCFFRIQCWTKLNVRSLTKVDSFRVLNFCVDCFVKAHL